MLVVYFMNEGERWNRKEYFKNQIGRKFREWCHFIYLHQHWFQRYLTNLGK